jgi:hypothetical protein
MNTHQAIHDSYTTNIVRLMSELQRAMDEYVQYQNTPEAWVFDSEYGIVEAMIKFMNEKAARECQYKKIGGTSAVAQRIIVNGKQKFISTNVLFYLADDDTIRNYEISHEMLVIDDHL